MERIKLNIKDYEDKVLACWLGKNIGGTLGTPYEGKKYVHNLTFYDPVPEKPLANDDLDFQLVWLQMLEDRGIYPTFTDFSDYWLKYLSEHWYNEYSFCTYNLQRGLRPPISGAFQNYYVDEMGAPIRSEIWACIAPGDPQLAASIAWMDGSLDHTGGEGRWGEMFWAAAESAAFVIKDVKLLIQIGLSMIPISSSISRVIREAVRCYESGVKWCEARERIATIFGHHQPCNAIPNHGFTILGLLYGKDYGDKLCKAVNCGYDTDCTGATLGSLVGIMHGTAVIPEEWRKPVGNEIIPCKQTVTKGLPETIIELTNRTRDVCKKFISERSDVVEFSSKGKTSIPKNVLSLLFRNDKAKDLLNFDDHCSVKNVDDMEITFYYGGEPVLYPEIERTFEISLHPIHTNAINSCTPVIASPKGRGNLMRLLDKNMFLEDINIVGPAEWKISKPILSCHSRLSFCHSRESGNPLPFINRHKFTVFTKKVENINTIDISLKLKGKIYKTNFVILEPGVIKQIPATANAPK